MFKKRALDLEMLPLSFPHFADYVSPPEEIKDEDTFNEQIQCFEAACEYVLKENDRRFEAAYPVILKCSKRVGFMSGFTISLFPQRRSLLNHYSWCPAPYWMAPFERR